MSTLQQPGDALVVFGITGDLARKMTLRSLYRLEPPRPARTARWSAWPTRTGPISTCEITRCEAVRATGEQIDDGVLDRFAARLSYVSGDFAEPGTYGAVAKALGTAANPVFYLEIPPSLFETVIDGLSDAELVQGGRRVVVEKPFGHDLESARELAAAAPPVPRRGPALPDRPLPRARWGSRRSSTCASPTRCSSRSGTAAHLVASRSRWPRASASRTAAISTTRSARFGTWSSTT